MSEADIHSRTPGLLGGRVVDLTHVLSSDIPLMPFQEPLSMTKVLGYDDGALVQAFRMDEHQGTHVDAPAHFYQGATTVEKLQAEDLLTRGYLLDVRRAVAKERDYRVGVDDVVAFEASLGSRIDGGVVVAWTGLEDLWSAPEDYYGMDQSGGAHFPGFSEEAARLLAEERAIVGLGIDGPSVDSASDPEYNVHRYSLGKGLYHIENLCGLREIGASIFTLVIGVIKLAEGSGAPARVLAVVE